MTAQPQASGNYEARLGVVEARVGSILEALEGLGKKIDARSGINWAPISILVTVLGLVGSMGFYWINTGQTRLEGLVAKMESRADRYVPREDLDVRFAVSAQRRDDLQRLTDARVERVERDFEGLGKQVVPRGEHEQMWAGQRMKDDGLQRQLDGLRKDLGDLNTPRDTIQGMQRRIDELERMRWEPSRK